MLNLNLPVRFSKWVHIFEKEGCEDIAIYHSLKIDVVFIEKKRKPLIDYLVAGTTGVFLLEKFKDCEMNIRAVLEDLFKLSFVVPIASDDMEELSLKKSKYILPVGLETLYLVLTDECNLRCSYCFINNNMPEDYRCKKMDWNTAKKAIDMFFFNISLNPKEYDDHIKMIFFYGGEPFLNFDILKKVVLYVEDRYSKELEKMGDLFHFNAISNGTVITDEIASFLSEHELFSVGLSLDGNLLTHDSQRINAEGFGSFRQTMAGYKKLRKFGCGVGISCTIGTHNIDSLGELLVLHDIHKFDSVSMNLLLDTERELVSLEYMQKTSGKILEYFEDAREKGVYEDRVMRKLKSFISKSIHPFDCQATGNQIVCSPEGLLGICHEGIGAKKFFFGNVAENFDFHNNEMINDWNKRSPLNMPQCYHCPAIGICGGGCVFSAWLRNGNIWSVDSRFCVHSLKTLEWLIWDLQKRL